VTDVFISYSSSAKSWAERLASSLEQRGLSTWADFKDVGSDELFLEKIERALNDSKCFLIVVGPKNGVGEWQEREWRLALTRSWSKPKWPLISVLLDDAPQPSFSKNGTFIRVQPGKPKSAWVDEVYDAIREAESTGRGAAKQSQKPDKAFQARLGKIESFAKQLKSAERD
jgi:hypothetical protein